MQVLVRYCSAALPCGLPGHVAAEEQLFDIYCFVKDPRCFTMLEDILASQSMATIISAIIDHMISEHTKISGGILKKKLVIGIVIGKITYLFLVIGF